MQRLSEEKPRKGESLSPPFLLDNAGDVSNEQGELSLVVWTEALEIVEKAKEGYTDFHIG